MTGSIVRNLKARKISNASKDVTINLAVIRRKIQTVIYLFVFPDIPASPVNE